MEKLILLILSILIISCNSKKQQDINVYWVWANSKMFNSIADWDSTMNKLNQNNINGLLLSASEEDLIELIPIAQKYNIEIHAWIWAINRADAKDEWLSVNAKGQSLANKKAYVNYYKFACPAIPEFQDFIINKIDSYSKIDGLKGIHLDYNRYVDVFLPIGLWDKYQIQQKEILPEYDYGYHPYMIELFKKKYGKTPYEIKDYLNNEEWIDFRCNQLNDLVEKLKETAHKNNKIVSSAVFPNPQLSKKMVRQDWGNWNLDLYFPMIYHSFYQQDIKWIEENMRKNIKLKGENIVCGLYMPALQKAEDFEKALEANIKAGSKAVSLFDLNSISEKHYEILNQYYHKFKN